MPIACISWVNGKTYNIITEVVKHERVTFTTVVAASQPCPEGANIAIVRCLEGDAMISNPDTGQPDVTADTGLRVAGNEEHLFVAIPGKTRISAIKAPS